MQRSGGDPADQQKVKIGRAVFRQIADIFKGSKTNGDGDGCRRHLFRLRLKNQIEKQQWQQFMTSSHTGVISIAATVPSTPYCPMKKLLT